MSADLTVAVREAQGLRVVVALRGVMDFDTVGPLEAQLAGLVEQGHPHLVLDVAQVDFCDSTGLNIMLRMQRVSSAAGGGVALAGASASLRRVLELTGADAVLVDYATVPEAWDAVGRD